MSVLIKPVITEKWTKIAEKHPRYGFVVQPDANKIQIKKDVEEMYSVTVESVNTLVQHGKMKARNTKTGFVKGRRKSLKRAIVTLRKGESIDFFKNV